MTLKNTTAPIYILEIKDEITIPPFLGGIAPLFGKPNDKKKEFPSPQICLPFNNKKTQPNFLRQNKSLRKRKY